MITINALWLVGLLLLCISILSEKVLDKANDFLLFIVILDVLWICWAAFDFGVFLSHHITITF